MFGDAGVYSFYATKAVPAGEGGIVITNDAELGPKVSDFVIYDRFKQKLKVGNNIRISEVQALLILSVVKEYRSIIKNKNQIAKKYINSCNDLGITLSAKTLNIILVTIISSFCIVPIVKSKKRFLT